MKQTLKAPASNTTARYSDSFSTRDECLKFSKHAKVAKVKNLVEMCFQRLSTLKKLRPCLRIFVKAAHATAASYHCGTNLHQLWEFPEKFAIMYFPAQDKQVKKNIRYIQHLCSHPQLVVICCQHNTSTCFQSSFQDLAIVAPLRKHATSATNTTEA